jgi:murein DD-endopeptidase MepM/ murein hydrolase activator NlpD
MPTFPLRVRLIESYKEPPRSFGAPRDHGARRHAGCDLYAPKGTPILAVADGMVTHCSDTFYRPSADTSYVGAIEVFHPGVGKIRYAEIGPSYVKAGDAVRAGQVIAEVGQVSGMANAMLHFELYAGTGSGALTNLTIPPFMRRADLQDPTAFLDGCRGQTASPTAWYGAVAPPLGFVP